MKKQIFFLLCLTPFLLKGQNTKFTNFKIEPEHCHTARYEFIEAIPLETNDSSLCAQVDDAKITDDYIVLSTSVASHSFFLVFDRKGKFLNRIEPIGNGPNEFPNSLGMLVLSPDQQSVLLKGNGHPNILRYGLDGRYIDRIPVDLGPYVRLFCKTPEYVYTEANFRKKPENMLWIYDNTGQKKGECVKAPQGITMVFQSKTTFTEYKGDIYYLPTYSSTVYRLSGLKAVPVYTFDFGNRFIDQEYILKHPRNDIFSADKDGKFLSFLFSQTDDWLRVNFFLEKNYDYYIHLKTGKHYVNSGETLPFNATTQFEDRFVCLVNALDFNEKEIYKELRTKVKVKEDDNPVVLFYRLKE